MSSVVFHPIIAVNRGKPCLFCLCSVEENSEKEWVGHYNESPPWSHNYHLSCLKKSVKNGFLHCPGQCQNLIDLSSIFSWTERIGFFVKPFLKNAMIGSAVTGFISGFMITLMKTGALALEIRKESAITERILTYATMAVPLSIGLAGGGLLAGLIVVRFLQSDVRTPIVAFNINNLWLGIFVLCVGKYVEEMPIEEMVPIYTGIVVLSGLMSAVSIIALDKLGLR